MKIREGDRVKSVLTGMTYEIKTLRDGILTLKSIDGSNQVWTEKNNLDLFYENIENSEASPDSSDGSCEVHPQEG